MAAQTATAIQTQADPQPAPDLAALKTRQQAAWSSGDYAVVGTTLQIVGEELCEALDLRAGQRVLDVAAFQCMVDGWHRTALSLIPPRRLGVKLRQFLRQFPPQLRQDLRPVVDDAHLMAFFD